MTKRKRTKGQTMKYKIFHRQLKIEHHGPTTNRGELMCPGRVSNSCSMCDTHPVTVKPHECHLEWISCWTPVYQPENKR